MSVVISEQDVPYTPHAYSANRGNVRDCGYLDTGRVRIGARFRDSQISAATPRVRSEVQYLGAHGERLQRALIEPQPSKAADVVLAVMLGIVGAAALVHWLAS